MSASARACPSADPYAYASAATIKIASGKTAKTALNASAWAIKVQPSREKRSPAIRKMATSWASGPCL